MSRHRPGSFLQQPGPKITMDCVELVIDPEWAWEPRKGLLGLPRELRDIIYNMVLVEPAKWERRHSALCDLCPRNIVTFERPAFDGDSSCKCASRCNMGLLLANRQIHRETAPIFWSQNKFCFDTPPQFAKDVGSNLRQEYVELLQQVSILRVTWNDYQLDWLPWWERDQVIVNTESVAMWSTLFRCSGLRTLEMGNECFLGMRYTVSADYDFTGFVPRLREELPHLEEFALSSIFAYDVNPKTSPMDPDLSLWDVPPISQRHVVYVKAQKTLDLANVTTAAEAKEALRAFNTNFMVHVKFGLETTLFGVAPSDFSTDQSNLHYPGYALANDLNDRNTSHSLKLRDGTVVSVRLLGLPLSQQTRLRHVKERWREDARRKSAGKPTVWEEKFKSVVRERHEERHEANREKRLADASTEYQARMEARETRREEAEAQERKQQRRARVKECVRLARSERQARETRAAERKRVWRPK